MRNVVRAGLSLWFATGALACGSGDDSSSSIPDASGSDASMQSDAKGSEAGSLDGPSGLDGGTEASADGGAPPPRLLLSYNGSNTSELVAFGLQSKAVDGRLTYPGFIGTTYVTPTSPWLMEQASDVVALLDPMQPWVIRSSWNVALNDEADSGFAESYSDPDGVVVGAGSKAYVLRYTRNLIAVIDSSVVADGGAPLRTIDLSSQLQAGGDGYVEMTAGWYDATNQRVYVLLGNINRGDVACNGYCQLCSSTSPTIVAIDTTTDTLVPLNGDAGTGDAGVVSSGYVLQGYDPAFGASPMVYDAANNRLLVLETGCNMVGGDGGAGALVKREVEAVSLVDGSTQMLLDLTAAAFPEALFYMDPHHVILQLDTAYLWDPTTTTLGPAIPNAPDSFSLDGQGNLLGVTQNYSPDGGPAGISVLSVSSGDGGVTILGQNPFSLTNGFIGGAQVWPAP
jgi:hypothetical protein